MNEIKAALLAVLIALTAACASGPDIGSAQWWAERNRARFQASEDIGSSLWWSNRNAWQTRPGS